MTMPDTQPYRPIRVLHLEDSAVDHQLVYRALVKSGLTFNMQRVETLQALQDRRCLDRAQSAAQAVSLVV